MARPYRIEAEDCLYHITSRGNERRNIFLDESDYRKFLHYLERAKEKYQYYLYAYVLMSNHYHFLIETPHANISKLMQSLNGAYTTYFNLRHKRSGHLFQGRFKSYVVQGDVYLKELTRYIHLNPVRARIVETPEQYRWSSYHEYIASSRKERKGLIDKEKLENYMEMKPLSYRRFVESGMETISDPFKKVYGGMILGGVKFIKETLKDLKDQIESKEISYGRDLVLGPELDEVVEVIAEQYKVDKALILIGKHAPNEARKIAVYVSKRITGKTNSEIGNYFGISYSAVTKTASVVEQKMEKDKRFSREINEILSKFKV